MAVSNTSLDISGRPLTPVLLGFEICGAHGPYYDGQTLAADHDVVVVTIKQVHLGQTPRNRPGGHSNGKIATGLIYSDSQARQAYPRMLDSSINEWQ